MATRIAVLGGGLSGLSAAYFLARGLGWKNIPAQIVVINKGNLGGWVQTKDTGKAKFELGPRSVRATDFIGLHTLKLVYDLDLHEELVPVKGTDVTSQNRFLYVNKQLNPMKINFKDVFKAQPPLTSSFASIFLKNIFRGFPPGAETMYEAFSYKFGEEVTKYHVDAFTRGVFAADIKELSVKAAFPSLFNMYKARQDKMPRKPTLPHAIVKYNELSGIKFLEQVQGEKWSQWNMEGGMAQFIEGLKKGCEDKQIEILQNTTVSDLSLKEDGTVSLKAFSEDETGEIQNEELEFDHVISALSAHDLSELLTQENFDPTSRAEEILYDVGSKLQGIKFVDVGVVNLEFEGTPEDLLPQTGFGHLVPSCEESNVLGIVYDSCNYPFHDRKDFPSTRMTCMMGGSWFEELFGDPDKVKDHDLEQAALDSVSEQLGITQDPTTIVTKLCRRCIPTYRTGHTDLVENIEDVIAEHDIPLSVVGSSYWGVSVNDCIYNSRIVADTVTRKLAGEDKAHPLSTLKFK